MTDTKISALQSGGAIQPTDLIPVARSVSGTMTSESVSVGTAAAKTASDNTKANLASVSGTIVAGHLAVFGDTAGSIVDGGAVPSGGTSGGLAAANNLSDLASVSTARTNLGLGSMALLNTTSLTSNVSGILPVANGGTGAASAGPTAANNVGALAIASNLSDLASASAARSNLGLGSSAVLAAGSANGVATLDGTAKIPLSQLPSSILNGLEFAGLWNASTNTPTLASGTGVQGTMYKVSVTGTTTLDGKSQWNAGDFAFFDGSIWDKVDGLASEVLSVAGRTGNIVLTLADIGGAGTAAAQNVAAFAQAANNLSDLASASTARTNLGLGTAATMAAGVASGVATLDGTGKVPVGQIPASATVSLGKKQIVATRAAVSDSFWGNGSGGRSDTRVENRQTYYFGRVACSQLQLGMGGFYMSATGEILFGNDYSYEAAFELTSPVTYGRAYLGSAAIGNVANGIGLVLTDPPVPYNIPAGGSILVRHSCSVASAASQFPGSASGNGGVAGDSGYVSTAANSQVAGTGALASPSGGTGYGGPAPYAVLGVPASPMAAVGFVGDSIPDGTGESGNGDAYGNKGFIARGLQSVNGFPMPYLRQTVGSWTLQKATLDLSPRIREGWQYVTHIINELMTNDITNSETLIQIQAYLTAMWTAQKTTIGPYGKPLKVYQTLCMPRVTSVQYLVSAAIAAGGSGYPASSTFNVTLAGGTLASGGSAATVNVTTNSSGVVTTVNSFTAGKYSYGATPAATNSATGSTGTGLSLTVAFAGLSSAADQTPVSGFAVGGIRDQANSWVITQVGGGLLDGYIDPNQYVEDQANKGCWITNGTPGYPTNDGIHPNTPLHILASQAINTAVATFTP